MMFKIESEGQDLFISQIKHWCRRPPASNMTHVRFSSHYLKTDTTNNRRSNAATQQQSNTATQQKLRYMSRRIEREIIPCLHVPSPTQYLSTLTHTIPLHPHPPYLSPSAAQRDELVVVEQRARAFRPFISKRNEAR